MQYKADILKHITSIKIGEYTTKEGYETLYLQTKVHPWYTKLRDRCYRNGRKEINSFMIKHLGLEGIAIWFGDDGYHENNQIILSTNCFSEAENYLAKELLKEKGIYCSVGRSHKYYYLRLSADSSLKVADKAKKMCIPLKKVCSYDRPPLDSFRRSDGTFTAGHKNEARWGDDIV